MKKIITLVLGILFFATTFCQTITYPGATPSFCTGSFVTLTASNPPIPTGAYTWEKSPDGTTGWTVVGSNSTALLVNSIGFYRVKISGPPVFIFPTLEVTENPLPVASFTSSPSLQCGTVPVIFNNTSTGAATYLWDFGDVPSGVSNNASTQINPTHRFVGTPGNATQNFLVKLTATTALGCNKIITNTVTTKQLPDARLGGQGPAVYNGNNYFKKCTNSVSEVFTFSNVTTTSSTNTNYQIIWGDGTPDYNATTFGSLLTHSYPIGTTTLLYIVTGQNGCIDTSTYYIFLGNNPSVGLGNPGNTAICTSNTLTFPISSTATNTAGTNYVITFSDGSAPISFIQPAPLTISHTFNSTSCGTNTNPSFPNAFSATILASNPCASSLATVVPIYVSQKPAPAFSISPKDSICLSNNISVTNTSGLSSSNDNGTCTPGKQIWSITPTTGWTLNAGNFGNTSGSNDPAFWINGTPSLNFSFSTVGTYIIKMKIGNTFCGIDSLIKTVCVNPIPVAAFTIDNNVGCTPVSVTTTNNSNTPFCGNNKYVWSVSYLPSAGCTPNTSLFNYLNGTNANSTNPQFQFTNPGVYTINLLTYTPGGTCVSVVASKTVTVKAKPIISIAALTPICPNQTISPTATSTCFINGATTYLWGFTGGSPVSASTLIPGSITYSTNGNYTISLDVTNECGTTNASQPLTVNPQPDFTAPSDTIFCAGQTTGAYSFTSVPTGATFSWTNSNITIGLAALGNTTIPVFTATNNTTTPKVATITITASNGTCTKVRTFTITVNPTPAAPLAPSPIAYCLNAIASSLTATATSGNTLLWYTTASGGVGSTTAPTPLTSAVGPTTFYVSQISTAYTCESPRTAILVNINALQTISNLTSVPPNVCGGSNGSLSFMVLNPSTTYTVNYLKNGNPVSVMLMSNASSIITITGLTAGTYSLITATLAGCPSSNLGPEILLDPNPPTTPTVSGNSPLCSGSSISLTASSTTGGVAYSWTGPVSFASTTQNPTITNATLLMSGNYSVVATLAGCTSAAAIVPVVISQTPVLPIANNNGPICAGVTLNLTASTTTIGTISYAWAGVGGFTSAVQNPTIPASTTANSGTYNVIATNTVGTLSCPSAQANTIVNIKPVPQISDSSATNPTTCSSATGTIVLKGLAINTPFIVNYTKNTVPVSVPLTSSPTGVVTILNLTAGVYANITVTLNGCISNIAGPFTLIDPTPPATPVVGSNSPICSGGTINLTATSTTPGVTYAWSGPASFASVSQNPTITAAIVSNSGTYSLTTTLAGCTSAAATVSVTVNQTPATPTLTSNTPVCTGNTLTLSAGTTTAGAMTFAWTGPNSFTNTSQNPTIPTVTQAAGGTYSVIFTSVAGSCPSTAGTTTVVVNETPNLTGGTTTNPTACASATGSITLNGLTANTANTINYINNLSVAVSANFTTNGTGALVIPNLVAGTYTNFKVISVAGCTSNTLPTFTLTNPSLPATPVATTNGPLCVGASLQLGATTTSAGSATYTWAGPNGFNSALQNPTPFIVSAASAGAYNVSVTINNCTSVLGTVTLVVNPLAVLPTVNTPISYCIDATTVSLTATANAGHTLNWYNVATNGTVLSSAPIPLSTAASSTTYYVSQTTALGCEGARAPIVVQINPNAKAIFTPTPTINCAPFNITTAVIGLQQFPANNSIYQWYANNVLIGTGINFPGYTIANQYDSVTIKLKTISLFGCKADSMEKKLYTYQVPVPSFTQSLIEGCGPLTVNFTNTTTFINLFTYNWDFGNGVTSTLQQPLPIVFATNPTYNDTTYIVKLTVASICNAVTFQKTVRVKSKPRALFTPDRTTGCSPMRVNMINTSKGLNNTYYWDFGDGSPTFTTTSRNTFQHIFITGVVRNYTIRLIAENDCGTDTTRITITTAPNNIQLLYSISGPDRYGCAPHTVAFFNNSNGASSFQWNFGDGNTLATTQNVQTVYHTYLVDGDYTVTLTAANNCTDTFATKQITVYPKPTAAFSTSLSNACIGQPIQMTNSSSSNATSYLWNFGDGTATSNSIAPQHTYTVAGPYTIKLIIYRVNPSGNVCTDTTTRNVLIVNTLPGDFTLSASSGTCAPLTVNFNNLTLPSVTTTWVFGDGSPNGTGDATTHTYTLPGVYNVTLTVTVAGGCTYIKTKQVNLLGPSGTFTYTGGFKCFGSPVTFSASGTNTNTYLWDFGDGITQTTTTNIVTHNYANAGTYIPSVKLQNTAGCNFPIQGLVPIKVDRITKGFTSAQQNNCGNTTVNFTDTSFAFFGKAQVKWLFGDGGTGVGSTVTHTYNGTGNYNVQMIVIGNSGCTDTTKKPIQVNVNNIPTANIIAALSKCTSDTVLFKSNVNSTDALNPMQWKIIQNGVTATGLNFSYRFGTAGTYTVRLIAGTVNGCFDTAFHPIVINPNPIVTSSNNLNLCKGNSAQLNTTGAPNFQWTPTNGLSCTNCPNPMAMPTITTPYVVVGTNSFGCTGSDTVVVTVIQPFDISVSPNVKICIGQSTNLLAIGANKYEWDNGNTLSSTIIANPVATPTITTDYRVIGYDGYNCFSDTAFVQVGVGKYPTVSLGADVTLATGTLLPLATSITNGPITDWLWKPATNLSCTTCPLPIATIKKDITYIVTVTTAYGCSANDTINIKTFCESAQVFIPNAFTPDGDGLNDVLMVRGTGIVSVKYFRIFNRWGEIVFERDNFPPNEIRYGWDGRIKGIVGPPDVFVYTAEVVCENGSTFIYKGNTSSIK
jgi:large repetitive protein